MDNLIGTLVFLLPGFLAYFWLQAFGLNPVVKHTPAEFSAVAALLWLPVSLLTLLSYNTLIEVFQLGTYFASVWTINDLSKATSSIKFIAVFTLLSTIISLILSIVWSLWGYSLLLRFINQVRTWRKIANYSVSPSVWDEVFLKGNPQVVEVGKIDKPESKLVGCIKKVSRPFEPERNLFLEEIDFFSYLVTEYNIPVSSIFVDIKSGTYIKIFNAKSIHEAQLREFEKGNHFLG